ncbi:MAG: hypothetical protein HY719_08985 [Planctomycetes bacterium]|nr:hypothetical protein [Planctomycetota bacterium]
MADVRIIANPVAGQGAARAAVERLVDELARLGMAAEAHTTTGAGDGEAAARRIAAALPPAASVAVGGGAGGRRGCVVACGGDGTVREVVNGIAGAPLALAVLPVGTANVLAKEWELPAEPGAVARLIAAGATCRMDLGRANGKFFSFVSGVGFDGNIVREVSRRRAGRTMPGMHVYVGPLLREMLRVGAAALRVEIDGREEGEEAHFVVVSKTANYGGPFQITSYADPTSGFLDVAMFRRPIRWNFIKYALLGLLRMLPASRDVHYRRGRRVVVRHAGAEPVAFQVDGDPGGVTPVSYDIFPEYLTLVVPEHRAT